MGSGYNDAKEVQAAKSTMNGGKAMKRKRTIKVFCFTAILMCALVPSMNIPDERTTAEAPEQTVMEEEVQMEKMQIVRMKRQHL